MQHFPDALDTAVFTTTHVVRHHSAILYVYHFEDGYWQFSGSEENLSDQDYLLLGLGEIIALDPSVTQIAHLPLGAMAYRESKQAEWVITQDA
ncbi:hypothetical protein [Hymenobacter sp. BT730]|uniref:hypothetical protein n=1 Tax=Hymenobacter sp. BT730 TaxID=3063332 RepID=UPI0026DF5326|nr:hypothetical protein [Hymenobacter sp. BT730]